MGVGDAWCKDLHEVRLIKPSNFDFAVARVIPAKDNNGMWLEKKCAGIARP